MASAWPEPPSAKFAGARDGMEALAFGGTEDSARPSALALFCADTEPGEGRLETSVKALVGDVGDGLESSAGERCSG
jgi:hypothetical protein